MNTQTRERYIGIDILRVIAMLSVVFLHTIYSFTVRTDFFLTNSWFVFEPLSAVSRSSLALFFIISGFLVVHKNRTVGENAQMTFQRIIIPLISFSLLASLFFLIKTKQSIALAINPSYIFGDVMKFPDNWLWFLVTMLFLYLLNPLWHGIFSDESKRTEARYVVLFFFLFTCFAILLKYITHSLLFFNSFTTWIGYICCYLYGALVRNKWSSRKSSFFYISLFLIGLIIEMGGDYFSLLNQKNGIQLLFAGYFTDNIALPPLLMAVGMFHIFINVKHITVINTKISLLLQKGIQIGAGLSYGVYLTHEFISQSLSDIFGWSVDSAHINIYLYNSIFFLVTLLGSAMITSIILRIPKLRMIIGGTP